MSKPRRSTTGCSLCKTRRKKCDETKPQCLRCLNSSKSCSYEYVEYSQSESYRVKRTKPAPRNSELLVKPSQNTVADSLNGRPASSFPPTISGDSRLLSALTPCQPRGNTIYSGLSLIVPHDSSSRPFIPISSQLLPDIDSTNALSTSLDFVRVPAGMISPTSYSTSQSATLEGYSNGDPEGIRAILCRAPTMDKSIKENTLPFVLYCYSQWAITSLFEPRKIIDTMRDQVVAQFSSENTRTRTILIANAMNMFVKNLTIDGPRKSIVYHLASEVKKNGAAFIATPPSFVPVLDRQNAIRILDNMLEILGLQLETQNTWDCIHSLENAAPVFRRACPNLPGRPINLPNLLLDLSLNPRYFATLDIVIALVTGLPTLFQYEVPFSLELCERTYQWQMRGNYGLQWLYGFPDQFIMLFAWINTLSETPGAGDNPELITWIERQLPLIKVAIDESGDPFLRIRRIVVLESWRFAAFIYLYMVLCKTNAHDPRVIRAQKGFMRLVREVKPGRNPDLHLITVMLVAGVVTTEEQDQETIRQRILNVRGCVERGTFGNDIMLRLEDVWARTRDEGRAAVWSDLRIACFRVTGR